jgi:hypothetical protein
MSRNQHVKDAYEIQELKRSDERQKREIEELQNRLVSGNPQHAIPITALPGKEDSNRGGAVLQWLRNAGAISICFGCLGLVKDFFWISVVAIYTGFGLIIWDITLLEQF